MLRRHRSVHAKIWFVLALALPLVLLVLAALRPVAYERPAERVEPSGRSQ